MKIFKRICDFIPFKQFRLISEKTNHLHEKVECANRKSKMLLHAVENNRFVDKQ